MIRPAFPFCLGPWNTLFCRVSKNIIKVNIRRQEFFQFFERPDFLFREAFGKCKSFFQKGLNGFDGSGDGAFIDVEEKFKGKIDKVEACPDKSEQELIFKIRKFVFSPRSRPSFPFRAVHIKPFLALEYPITMNNGNEPIEFFDREAGKGQKTLRALP